jgi:hypothetical protein
LTLVAGVDGWSATIERQRTPATVCAVAVDLPNPVDEGMSNGEPACR